jgi:hypothetical protein
LRIDVKELIEPRYDSDGCPVLRIELHRLEKLAPCMCPTRCMHNLGAAHIIVCRIAITLEERRTKVMK